MSTLPNYTEYTEHLRNSKTPFIGLLAWFHVSERAEIKQPDLAKLVEATEAPIKVPKLAKPANLFRRACTEAQRNKIPTGKPGTFYNFMIRDLGYDDICVRRQLVAEQVDSKQRELGYDILTKMTFNKITNELTFEDNEEERDDATLKVVDEIRDEITDFLTDKAFVISPVVMRSLIRNSFESALFGTSVRQGGGVYFIRMNFAEQLEAVDHVCRALDGAAVDMLPLVDDAKQRSMVKEAFKAEVSETSSGLVTRMKELLNSNDPVTAKEYDSVLADYTEAKKRLDLYGDILSSEKSYVESSLEIVNFQLQALLEKD
jgi:hypothetical protein